MWQSAKFGCLGTQMWFIVQGTAVGMTGNRGEYLSIKLTVDYH